MGQADEVLPRLAQIQDRYETAGSALATFAEVLDWAQSDVSSAIEVRESTSGTIATYDAQISETQHSMQWAPADQIEEYRDELVRLENAVEPMTTSLLQAQSSYDQALTAVHEAGDAAERRITEAVDADGLSDSAWDSFKSWVTDNMGWIKVLKDALSIIATALGVLSIFFPLLLPFAAAFALATLVTSSTLAATGNGSWLDVGLDFVALATLGVGSVLGSGVKIGVRALKATRASRLAWRTAKQPGILKALSRPARAVRQFGSASARVGDDLARALPEGMVLRNGAELAGRPVYRSLEDVWKVFRGGGTDGAAFASIAKHARLGSGGMIDDAILYGGQSMRDMAFTNNIIGVADAAVSWHDDFINGGILGITPDMREVPGQVGRALGQYSDWWSEVDGGTFDVVGNWDPAGRSS
ncbi:hypothetical protein [Isoptericola sp. BMS4]|uniref:hypothetical protein n=1 Tax=Isoptericola sp. BMS4 TaxID=2527875 RepID=UPI001424240A|nr:hypothetical protein [Isoptericola sp. BMS4]